MPELAERVMTEARARIMRGEDRRDVEAWLETHGLPPEESRAVVGRFWKMRDVLVKRKGRKYVLTGLVTLAVTVVFHVLTTEYYPEFYRGDRGRGYQLVIGSYILGAGLFLAGLYSVTYGARSYGSVHDMFD